LNSEVSGGSAWARIAGPCDTSPWIHLPIGYTKTNNHPVLNWRFETEPQAHMGGRQVHWPRGRVPGGSSSINGMILQDALHP
jgi:choline dehydrogenase